MNEKQMRDAAGGNLISDRVSSMQLRRCQGDWDETDVSPSYDCTDDLNS